MGSKRSGFWYADRNGRRIADELQLARIRSLALPPAWTDVRINPAPAGPLQAVGVDAAGRVQYRYHAVFAQRRARVKYEKIERFGAALPLLRRLTNEHIYEEGFSREKVLAVVVRLINDLYFRLGSEASVRRYRTYGITTLRNHHLRIEDAGVLQFRFVGKDHVRQRRVLVDEDLAAVMAQLRAIGGARLFNYLDEAGKPRSITPRDVNHYIKSAIGEEFSSKDFRTWGGTLKAAIVLAELGPPRSEREAKRNISACVRRVAEYLGNTPTVCRSCYIHPTVLDRYREGVTLEQFRQRSLRAICRRMPEYDVEELELLRMIGAQEQSPALAAA